MENQQKPNSLAAAIAVTPETIAALMSLGHAYYQQGKMTEARDVFEGLILLDATNPYAHGILGCICEQQNQYEQAIEAFSKALKIFPSDINSLTNRGECYLHLGRFEESARDLKAAIQLDPDEKNPAANRARFLTSVTLEALKLAEQGGQQAVDDAKRRFDDQLSKS